jgi:hypothetical protein
MFFFVFTACTSVSVDSNGSKTNDDGLGAATGTANTNPTSSISATESTTSAPIRLRGSKSEKGTGTAQLVADTSSEDACLPFVMPSADTLFGSSKKVFAHYISFPLSIDNKPASQDYYNTQFLNAHGENNKWLSQGGFLRQRPLSTPVLADSNWQEKNFEKEIRLAIARGITGFTVDVMAASVAADPQSYLNLLLNAAQIVDPRFKIVVMPDMTTLGTNQAAVVQIISDVASSPSAYRLFDGRLVVSAFDAGLNAPEWWESVIQQLSAQGISVAFVPTFLGWDQYAAAFSTFSYGLGDWGTATPAVSSDMQAAPLLAHTQYEKIFMMPVDPQQFRPKDFIYWEAGNSAAFRSAWTSSIAGNADWVQLVTWSDFSESSEVEPYTDITLQRDIGTGFYDLTGYYASWFITGSQPMITHDVLFFFYRKEPTNSIGPDQSKQDSVVNGNAEDSIELLAFLTAPGELTITINGHDYTQSAPAGITSFKVPLQPGIPIFTLSRNNADVLAYQGPVQIVGTNGIPSGLQDMTYWSGSAAKSGICSL